MSDSAPFYDTDLAYIHDVGFGSYAEGCSLGLLKALREAGVDDGLVVDLGCGGGIWAKRLAGAGYEVVGIDLSPAMVAVAEQRVPAATFRVGSVWKHSIPDCRAVTALGEVLCYRSADHETHDLRKLFRRVYKALAPGGLLIFDVAEVGLERGRKPTFAEGEDWACLVRLEYDEKREQLHRHITAFRQIGDLFRRSHEQHIVQLYRTTELARLLRETGFRVRTVRRFGDYPLLRKRAGFIARKP
jgi:SAM-dependent methyltransferase